VFKEEEGGWWAGKLSNEIWGNDERWEGERPPRDTGHTRHLGL
jgi:hypothetical protein